MSLGLTEIRRREISVLEEGSKGSANAVSENPSLRINSSFQGSRRYQS